MQGPSAAGADERRAARRIAGIRVSAALLAAGCLAFWVSLALPAVTKFEMQRRMHLDGFTCAVHYGPTAASNGFLALAFVVWGAAVWFRSVWAWYVGAAMSVIAFLHHAFIGAMPGFENIERVHSGYWTWLAATATVAVSFLVLPKPVRPPPGEPLPVADRDRGRVRLGVIFGAAASAVLLVTHLFLPVPIGALRVPGPPPEGADTGWYGNGPTRSSAVTTQLTVTHPDGTKDELPFHYEEFRAPPAVAQFRGGASGALEFALLSLPLLVLASAATRRRAWRWIGAATSAACVLAATVWIELPWPCSGITPRPLDIVWKATPSMFAAAFLLLPPRRAQSAPATVPSARGP